MRIWVNQNQASFLQTDWWQRCWETNINLNLTPGFLLCAVFLATLGQFVEQKAEFNLINDLKTVRLMTGRHLIMKRRLERMREFWKPNLCSPGEIYLGSGSQTPKTMFLISCNSRGWRSDRFLPFGEGNLWGHCNLALAPLDGDHTTTQVAGFPVHFDALLKKLLLEKANFLEMSYKENKNLQISEPWSTLTEMGAFCLTKMPDVNLNCWQSAIQANDQKLIIEIWNTQFCSLLNGFSFTRFHFSDDGLAWLLRTYVQINRAQFMSSFVPLP